MNDKVKPSLFKNLNPDERKLFDELSSPPKVTISINEHEFVGRYLPILYNFYTGDIDKENIGKFRAMWINEVSGNGYNEVNVVNINGDIVAVVPPVFGRVQYTPKDAQFSLASAFKTYHGIARNRGETAAVNMLKQIMFNAEINKEKPLEDRWNALFDYYKCGQQESAPVVESIQKSDFNEDDYTYEL